MTAVPLAITEDDHPHRREVGVDGWIFLVSVTLVPFSNILPLGVRRIAPSDLGWILLASVLLQLRRKAIWPYIYKNPVLLPVLVIIGYMAATALLGAPFEGTGHALLQAASLAFYLLLVLPIFAYYTKFSRIIWGILVAGVAFDALLLLLGLIGVPYTGMDTGNGRFRTILTPVGSLASNAAAVSALFALGAVLKRSLWGVAGVAMCIFVINMDKSRTALIAFGVMCIYVFLIAQVMAGKGGAGLKRRLAYFGIVGGILAVMAVFVVGTDRYKIGLVPTSGLESVDFKRALGYKLAIDAVVKHPLFGNGFQTTRTSIVALTADDPALLEEVVHNGYLQLSADLGLPAGIALMFVLFVPLRRMGKALVRCLRAQSHEIDAAELMMESAAFFAVFALVIKMCFHPVGLLAQDWIFFIAAAPRFYSNDPNRCLKVAHGS